MQKEQQFKLYLINQIKQNVTQKMERLNVTMEYLQMQQHLTK